MHVISIQRDGTWHYITETSIKNSEVLLSNKTYGFSPNIREAKIFESGEEARIFWKVSKDKKLIPPYSENENLGIRKILFKQEKNISIA